MSAPSQVGVGSPAKEEGGNSYGGGSSSSKKSTGGVAACAEAAAVDGDEEAAAAAEFEDEVEAPSQPKHKCIISRPERAVIHRRKTAMAAAGEPAGYDWVRTLYS